LVERHVVFQTIKIAERLGRFESDYGSLVKKWIQYDSYYFNDAIIPIADVLPFHVVGGHISTNLDARFWDIVLSGMDAEGILSKLITAKLSFPRSDEPKFRWATSFLDLQPIITTEIISGRDLVGRRAVSRAVLLKKKQKVDLITHIHMQSKAPPGSDAALENSFVTMTLIIEKESE
jgi:hypothetical protein